MVKPKKKELLSSAPWRVDDNNPDEFAGAKLRATKQPGGESTMYVPGKKKSNSLDDHDDGSHIDSELRYTFQRNSQFLQQVFTIDTLVKPLPPTQAYYVSRSLGFFTSIFTQFFDPEGIAKAQKSLGIGEEEKVRRVR